MKSRTLVVKSTRQNTRLIKWLGLECDFHGMFKSEKYQGHKMGMPNKLVYVFTNY